MNKKWKRILMTVYVLVLILMLSTATFAYFSMIQVTTLSPQVQAESAVTDWLIFSTGDPINIEATEENFGEDMGDISGRTYGGALLQVSDSSKEVSYNYNVILNIVENEFVYTTPTEEAELLLKVTDPDGAEVTNIPGLVYKEVTNGNGEVLRGFDITTEVGNYYIANNYEITSNLQTQHIWNVEVILVNLDSDQNANAGKVVDAYLEVSKGE